MNEDTGEQNIGYAPGSPEQRLLASGASGELIGKIKGVGFNLNIVLGLLQRYGPTLINILQELFQVQP